MSGNVDKKLLGAYIALRERAAKGDGKAKEDLAKIVADPQAVMKIRTAAARVQQTQQLALAALSGPTTEVVGEDDDYVPGADDIADAEEAHRQLPPGSDSLDHKALLRKNKAAALGNIAPFVNQNPPDVVNGMQGNAAIVQPGELLQVCNFQGDDAHCSALTLSIFPVQQLHIEDAISQTDGPIDIPSFRPYTRLRFGCKGAAAEALVDVGTGIQLTVSGSMATIEVGLHNDLSGHALTTFDPQYRNMKIAGMISAFKPIVRTSPITYTVYADLVGAGVTYYYIPPFAKSVLFAKAGVNLATDTHLTVTSLSVNDPVNEYTVDIPANQQQTVPLVIPGNGALVAATNAAGSANIIGMFIFELDI